MKKEYKSVEKVKIKDKHNPEKNVYAGMPENGTILCTLTPEELKQHKENSIRIVAIKDATDVSVDRASSYHDQNFYFWEMICKKYSINYAWPIGIDRVTGHVFISK